jgi:hypothetical protein
MSPADTADRRASEPVPVAATAGGAKLAARPIVAAMAARWIFRVCLIGVS